MVAYIAKCFMVATLAPDFAVVKLIIDAREMVVPGGVRFALLCQTGIDILRTTIGTVTMRGRGLLSPHRRSRSQRPRVRETLSPGLTLTGAGAGDTQADRDNLDTDRVTKTSQ